MCFCCCKCQIDSVYFRFVDINITQMQTCEADDRLITGMEWFLYFINIAILMTWQLLLETVMLPNSVIHQLNFWIERKNDGHLHFSNVYLWRHSADLSQRFFRTDHPDTDAQFICSDVKVTQGSHDIDCGCNTKNMQSQMIDMSTQIVKYLTQTISNKCMVQEGRRYRLFEVSNVKDEYLRC